MAEERREAAAADTSSGERPRAGLSLAARLARASFWLGVFLMLLVSAITSRPGDWVGGSAIIALFVAGGLFVPGRGYRLAAVCLLALLLMSGISDYRRGIEYQQRLIERRASPEPLQQRNSDQGTTGQR